MLFKIPDGTRRFIYVFGYFLKMHFYVNNAAKKFSCFKTIQAIDNKRFHQMNLTTKDSRPQVDNKTK